MIFANFGVNFILQIFWLNKYLIYLNLHKTFSLLKWIEHLHMIWFRLPFKGNLFYTINKMNAENDVRRLINFSLAYITNFTWKWYKFNKDFYSCSCLPSFNHTLHCSGSFHSPSWSLPIVLPTSSRQDLPRFLLLIRLYYVTLLIHL